MSKLKKILLMCTAYVLVAALAIGGTLAYLTSQDSDVNVMTLGNVEIEQIEQQRGENGDLESFEDNKPAFPAVGPVEWDEEKLDVNGTEYKVFTDDLKNVVDKIVTVKNTGKSPAYVRTIVAIEAPDYDPNDLIHINYNDNGVKISAPIQIEKDGVKYVAFVFTYNEALPAGATSVPSLMQVFLDSEATNEDCEKFGDTWEIIVVSQAIQTNGFASAEEALNEGFGTPVAACAEWLDGAFAAEVDTWDGTADTSWYNDTDTEFLIMTAEQLAGFAKLVDDGKTFEGKTVKLGKDIDLYCEDENGEAICFDPIGSYRFDASFKGTFDGQGYAVKNLSQNTWALDNGYYYTDCGLGLFGAVENGTVKNLVIDGANISGESALCGTVAAVAQDATFENITVKNTTVADYQYYAGGIVGWASGEITMTGINVDASTVVGSQWGDFGNANGGIIGGIGSSANILFKDSTVACRIDATNDVVSAYQWYNYRNSGMLVGRVPQTITNGEVQTVKTPENVTCENVTVVYGDWANYTYCEFAGTGYPFVRVQAGSSVEAYSNVRYGHPTDANGNTVVDDNHVHNDGEKHHELIAFDQLFGGPADHRYCYYGIPAYDGVNVVYNNK